MKLEGGMYHDIKVRASFGRHLSYDLCHSCFLRNNIILFVEISFYLDLISLFLEIISFSGENSIPFGKKLYSPEIQEFLCGGTKMATAW